jgi:hypothetical protein
MAPSDDLVLARRHLVEAHVRIDKQRRLIAHLEEGGHPLTLAEQLLSSLIATTEQMQAHHDYLVGRERDP